MSNENYREMAKSIPIAFLLSLLFLIPTAVYATNAQCGAANGQGGWPSAPNQPRDLCSVGSPSSVRGNGPWTWYCSIPNGLQNTCFAAPAAVSIVALTPAQVTLSSIKGIIARARKTLRNANSENTTVALKIPAGAFDLSKDSNGQTIYCNPPGACSGVSAIDLNNVTPGPEGRLLILGQGPDQTEFITSPDQVQFSGHSARRITIAGINLSQDRLEASQGMEVGTSVATPDGSPYWAGIDIESGFPQMQPYPQGLWNSANQGNPGNGQYLRRYLAGSPCNIDTTLRQFHYNSVVADSQIPNRWWFGLVNGHNTPIANPFNPNGGDLIGIKSKAGGGQAYFFANSNDIIFDDVVWTRSSRGVFRSGTINAQIYDSQILLDQAVDGQAVCLASSSGGPQMGQPHDPATSGNVVDNLYAENTGDDTIAAFNDYNTDGTSGIAIRNSYITNSFARSIYLRNTPYEVPDGIDSFTEQNLFNCNSAHPVTDPVTEPSQRRTGSDIGFSECVLYQPGV